MYLNEIAVFVRVAEAQSFTQAAKQLGLPKSTVSRSIARLEEDLGVPLLQRTTRKLKLTDAGAAYYERVKQSLLEIEEARKAVTHLQEVPSGTLRITASPDFGSSFLAEILARFVARQPTIHVHVTLTKRHVDLIAEGFDLALRAGRLEDSSLIGRKLCDLEGRLFATPAYLARHGVPQQLADLQGHECVLFRPRGDRLVWRLSGPHGIEEIEVSGRLGGDDFSFVRAAMLADRGIALLPWFACAQDLVEGRVSRVLPDYEMRGAALYLVYPPSERLPRKVTVFRDFLIDSFSPAPWTVVTPHG